ncbi:MAG: hypothetical protein K2Y18_00135 [Alphaproteobacteria bacterium]|nr:hypothetical protein [Alphaproteobacteria bacterium]
MKIIPQVLAVTLSFLVVEHGNAMDDTSSRDYAGEDKRPGSLLRVESREVLELMNEPVIDFRYWCLELGLKDQTGENAVVVSSIYGKADTEFYDDYYGVSFSQKQPSSFNKITGKKHLPFSGEKVKKRLRKKVEEFKAYDVALKRLQEAEIKYTAETKAWNEKHTQTTALVEDASRDLLASINSLSNLSGFEDQEKDQKAELKESLVVQERTEVPDTTHFSAALKECKKAKDAFDRILKKLLADHPLRVDVDDRGDRVIIFRTQAELEELIYDSDLRDLADDPRKITILHSTSADLENKKNRVKGFTIGDDPLELIIRTHMLKSKKSKDKVLQGRNGRAHDFNRKLKDALTRYKRDYREKVKHVVSLTDWSDYCYGTTFQTVQDDIQKSWTTPPSLARHPLMDSATDKEKTHRLLGSDDFGKFLAETWWDTIIKFQESLGDLANIDSENDANFCDVSGNLSCAKTFFEIFRTSEEGVVTTLGADEPLELGNRPRRDFQRPFQTTFYNGNIRAPEHMRFHRSHWHKVMAQLHNPAVKKKWEERLRKLRLDEMSPVELLSLREEYKKEAEKNEKLHKDIGINFQKLQTKPKASLLPSVLPSLLPAPIELLRFKTLPPEPELGVSTSREEEIELRSLELKDRHVHTMCLVRVEDHLQYVPLLSRYSCLDLGNNWIEEPFKFPFGFAFQTTLVSLDLSFNRLKSFDFLPTLKALRKFNGSGNTRILSLPVWGEDEESILEDLNLSHINLKEVESLCFLSNLTALDLSHTKIQELRPLASLVKLVKLDVSNTRAQNLMKLDTLVVLEELLASECLLMEGTWKEVVPPLPLLKRLELRKNPIKWFPYNTLEKARKVLSSSDNVNNDREFNETFPNLVSLGAEDEFLEEKIKLSDLKSNPMFFGK